MYQFTTKLEPFARGFLSCQSANLASKIAAGILLAAKEMPITFELETGLVFTEFGDAVGMHWADNVFCNQEKLDALIQAHPEAAADLEYIKKQMVSYTKHHNMNQFLSQEQLDHKEAWNLWGGTWFGHGNPNHIDIARYGTDAIRAKANRCRAENPGKDTFYDAVVTVLDALDILGARICEQAEAICAQTQDAQQLQRLTAIRDTFRTAPKAPCRDFVQAVIVYTWVYFFDGNDSPGYFDQMMYPFWKVTDPDTRRWYLEALFRTFQARRAWNLCIGGSDENWNDLSNGLTYEILDVVAKLKSNAPNLTMRCHKNTPRALMEAAYRTIATGCGMPALYHDEVVCAALERLGIPPCDAHLYAMNGCNQIDIQGKSHMGLEDGEVSFPAALEHALYDGMSVKSGKELGLRTGDPRDFESFDAFYGAFLQQLDHLAYIACETANTCQRVYARMTPNPLRSALIEGCLEKGLDYKAGGPLYGHGQILMEGIADTADSLAAIKKYVYEDQLFTMEQLLDALTHDFEGYEDLYLLVKHSELKYGNDNDYVDEIAADMVNHFNRLLRTIPTVRGGYYSGGCSTFNRSAHYGIARSAMPNGKKYEEYILADSIGATPGCDTNGPTALLKSCAKLDQTLPGSGFVLNLKFDKDMFRASTGFDRFLALVNAYFQMGGQMVTATVVSEEELLDAQIHPENHRNLLVRVGGYSAYFNDLTTELQNNVIARTRYSL